MDFLDDDFYNQGAFLTDIDQETVILAKGGTTSEVSHFDRSNDSVFYLKDFYTDKYLKYSPSETLKVSLKDLRQKLHAPKSKSFEAISNDDEIYQEDFRSLKKEFNEELKKVVLVSREDYLYQDNLIDRKTFFIRAIHFEKGLPYGYWNNDHGILGATPEILFSLQDSKLQTLALAGTAKKGEESQLLNSPKDKVEHDLVIQDIVEKLSHLSSQVTKGQTGISEFKNLIHLKTEISAEISPHTSVSSFVSLLSPTAALGGYPTNRALEFLKSSKFGQKYPKRFFGSAFGMTSKDINLFVVMIRNIEFKKDLLSIESGGGVVNSSDLHKEMEEIKLKRAVIRNHYL